MSNNLPKQTRAIETRTAILDAAQICFAQNGFDATRVAEICQTAGLSKGAFYHHFPSKQAVYLELLNQWLEDFERGLETLREKDEDVPTTLRMLSKTFPSIFEIAEGQLPIIFDLWAKASRDPHIWQATIAPFEHYYQVIAELIEEGTHEKSLIETDARKTALILISIGVGALLQGLLSDNIDEWGAVGQDGIDWILKTIERKA